MATFRNNATCCMKCDNVLLQASRLEGYIAKNIFFNTLLPSAPEPQEHIRKGKPAVHISTVRDRDFPDDHKRRWLIPVIVISVCLSGIGTWIFGFSITEANAMVLWTNVTRTAVAITPKSNYQPFTSIMKCQ